MQRRTPAHVLRPGRPPGFFGLLKVMPVSARSRYSARRYMGTPTSRFTASRASPRSRRSAISLFLPAPSNAYGRPISLYFITLFHTGLLGYHNNPYFASKEVRGGSLCWRGTSFLKVSSWRARWGRSQGRLRGESNRKSRSVSRKGAKLAKEKLAAWA